MEQSMREYYWEKEANKEKKKVETDEGGREKLEA